MQATTRSVVNGWDLDQIEVMVQGLVLGMGFVSGDKPARTSQRLAAASLTCICSRGIVIGMHKNRVLNSQQTRRLTFQLPVARGVASMRM